MKAKLIILASLLEGYKPLVTLMRMSINLTLMLVVCLVKKDILDESDIDSLITAVEQSL